MAKEKLLVIIKPDAMARRLAGNIISDIYNLDLEMIGLKLVNVKKELAEQHYHEHKEKPFYNNLIRYITGELHEQKRVIAIAYEGENAIKKLRERTGKTNPDEAHPASIRGKYGKINSKTNNFDNVLHVSDSPENGDKEIALWFKKDELVQ